MFEEGGGHGRLELANGEWIEVVVSEVEIADGAIPDWVGSMIEFRPRTAEPLERDFHGTLASA